MGVESFVSFHLHMRLNGQYFGKYAFVEQVDTETLKVGWRVVLGRGGGEAVVACMWGWLAAASR